MKRKNINKLIYYIAMWLPVLFATPLIIMAQNPDDFTGGFVVTALILALLTFIISGINFVLVNALKFLNQKLWVSFFVSLATVLVLQGYVVHGFFEYGQLDGTEIDWKGFGWVFWFESVSFIILIVLLSHLYLKVLKHLVTISYVLIFFTLAQLSTVSPHILTREPVPEESKTYDSSVYEFSSTQNIIHILADGFQADIVKQVLDENPDIAESFSGFDFFYNHLGRFQGTSPTIPSIFNGQFFDLNKGYSYAKHKEIIKKQAYTNTLYDAGYQLDFAPISSMHCHINARNCDPFSFNDLKPRGYEFKKSTSNSLMLLLDVSLFRHTPMSIKQDIYNSGGWFLSPKFSTDLISVPFPVIDEWTQHLQVTTDVPVYKWYHFIGTHIPAQWNSNCGYLGRQPQERSAYLAQTECILKGMASFFKKLKTENIYDNTTIIINGDHGCNIPANDLYGMTTNKKIFTNKLLGTARPVFMFKKTKSNKKIKYHDTPTTMEDIAPTILDVVGLEHKNYSGFSAYSKQTQKDYKRYFHRYNTKTYRQGDPIEYTEYQVTGDSHDRSNWHLNAIHNAKKAPSSYPYFSFDSAYEFTKGMSLSPQKGKITKGTAILGYEFFVLLSEKETTSKSLLITLKVYQHTENQRLSVYIDNKIIADNVKIKPVYGEWVTQEIPIPKGTMKKENNLFKFQFSKTGHGKNNIPISAKIKSIHLQ